MPEPTRRGVFKLITEYDDLKGLDWEWRLWHQPEGNINKLEK